LNTEAFWIITVYYHSEVGRVISVARNVGPGITQGYVRHRPENTQLYQIIDKYHPDFQLSLAEQDKRLPRYVEREFDEFLRCGRLEYGFLRAVCDDCKHEKLVAFSCKRHRFCPSCGSHRMVENAALLADEVLSR
jgi:ribosomal protein S27E